MGARLVLDLNPGGSSSPQSMISIDGMLYFTADLGGSNTGEPIPEPVPDNDQDINSEEEIEENPTQLSVGQLGSGLALLKSDGLRWHKAFKRIPINQ